MRSEQEEEGREDRGERGTFSEAREYGGTPLSYFPEMIPQASGDQVIAPTPEDGTHVRGRVLLNDG